MNDKLAVGPADDGGLPSNAFTREVQSQVLLAERFLQEASDAVAEAQRVKAFWQTLSEHLSRGEYASLILHLDRNSRQISFPAPEPSAAGFHMLQDLRIAAESRVAESSRSIGRVFPEAARAAGLVIDPASRHPKYTFGNGFVRLEVDEKRRTAAIETREGDRREYGLDVDLLVRMLRGELERLFGRGLNREQFLRSLYTAYAAALRVDGLADGTEVPIRRVTHRLAKNLNKFALDEFNIDLAKTVQSGQTAIDGRKLHLNHTRNTRQGMLLAGMEQGGYVGLLSFKPEDTK
jgi:hypothetical protein